MLVLEEKRERSRIDELIMPEHKTLDFFDSFDESVILLDVQVALLLPGMWQR